MTGGLNGNKTLLGLIAGINLVLVSAGVGLLKSTLDEIKDSQKEEAKANAAFREWTKTELALKPYRSEIPQLVVPAPETRRRLRRLERRLGIYEEDE